MPVTINAQPVVSCRLVRPRVGAWWGDFVVASSDAVTGAASIVIDDGPTMAGFVVASRSRVFLDTFHCRIVGGAGGLHATSRARFYRTIQVRTVLADILAAGGESLSSTSTSAVLSTQLDFWSVGAIDVGASLSMLSGYAGAVWRVLDDGTIFFGSEEWPTTDPERVLIDETPTEDRVTYGVTAPGNLLPGTVIDGRRISRVESIVEESRIREVCWLEAA